MKIFSLDEKNNCFEIYEKSKSIFELQAQKEEILKYQNAVMQIRNTVMIGMNLHT